MDLISDEKAWELMKKYGLETEEELQEELKKNPIEIGMFTMPFPRSVENVE